MSKTELLSWTSLATSTSVLVFYLLIVFGWPDAIPDYSARFVKIFFNVFWVAVIIEMLVDMGLKRDKVGKDERDAMIESKGLKVGYSVLVVAVVFTLIQFFLSGLVGPQGEAFRFMAFFEPRNAFHFLFLSLFAASASKRIIMIYNYRKDY
jgi:hypothetical protein